ncbi:hypothetical protein [Nocardioides sp. B-3]|uniref:hypothetical protein n=1 Tax=Nocardioides sp. B-3 TaxID=2895565 RepID=UPI003FA5EF77
MTRASSTSSCPRLPTVSSPPGWMPPRGSTRASAEDRSTRAWRVDRPLAAEDVESRNGVFRTLLLIIRGTRDRGGAGAGCPHPAEGARG